MEFKSFQIHVSIYSIFPYNLVYISINTNPVFMQGSFFLLTCSLVDSFTLVYLPFLSCHIQSKPILSLFKPF